MSGESSRKRIYVIGGRRGIGRAIALGLAEDGYDIVFTSRSMEGQTQDTLKELQAIAPKGIHEAAELDVSDRARLDAFAERVETDEGMYGLVYNAGQSYDQLAAAIDADKAQALMQVNFFGFMRLAGAALRPLVRAKSGRLVAIGSITSLYGTTGNASYAATKGAMLGYVRTLAVEVARKGVTVNYVAPGFIKTDLLAPYEAHLDKLEVQIPSGKVGQPEDIAHLVRFIVSPGAHYMTGSYVSMDGGLSANAVSKKR